ncbi:response regulator transcription factor [Paenibacillus thermotolerans]|uniref:response regulator transcription factor n=1 Tax=Paenibacillus thermotolerans TaxID=3027807 RepID=UPI002367C2F6|nr:MULTISPECIES: response regulator [unclassified Paenibacillus]
MTVFVRDPIQHFTRQLLVMTQASYVKSSACGLIVAKCTNDNPRFLVQLQSYLTKNEPELVTECYYDDQSRVLGVVLEDRRLAGTHYSSLVCKEFLERHGLLDGQMFVASFPESGEPSERIISRLFTAVAHDHGESKDINLYADRTESAGVSSILIADTEETSRQFIKLRLEMKGYEVFEAKDGSEALEKFTQHTPDLVITELNLPVIDGYQLIHRIKEEHDSDGKVIVLTDKHLTKDMNRAFELGVTDYVTKPFSISELEWRIRKLQFS